MTPAMPEGLSRASHPGSRPVFALAAITSTRWIFRSLILLKTLHALSWPLSAT
jgi:hypothetical protein